MPEKEAQSAIDIFAEIRGEFGGAKYGYSFFWHECARQLSRQAKWEAERASKAGNNTLALSYLQTMRKFASIYSSAEPYRMIPFLVGHVMWQISSKEEIEILKKTNNTEQAKALEDENQRWKDACKKCEPLLAKTSIIDKSIKISPTEYFQYGNYHVEEDGMREIFRSLGLVK